MKAYEVVDHIPVHIVFPYLREHVRQEKIMTSPVTNDTHVKWDQDLVMRGLREGFRKSEFVAGLGRESEKVLRGRGPAPEGKLNTRQAM